MTTSLERAVEDYKRILQTDAPSVDGVPEDKQEEAATLLKQAADMNKPFASDDDFRKALGLTGSQ